MSILARSLSPVFISSNLIGQNGSLRRLCSVKNEGKFWKWTCQSRPHWKESKVEAAVLFCVFGVTGSSSMYFVRPTLSNLGLKGNFMDGPWSYRIASVLIISPIYACILVTIGTLAGRHIYFANMGKKIISRFLPKSQASKVGCPSVSNPAMSIRQDVSHKFSPTASKISCSVDKSSTTRDVGKM